MTGTDIEAVLKARRYAAVEQSAPVSLPPLPVAKSGGPRQPSATVTVQSLIQPAGLPSVQVAPPPEVSDEDVSAFLESYLPMLIRAAQNAVMPPLGVGDGVQLSLAVTQAVAAGLPQMRGGEARALAVVVTRLLWRKYAAPLLPAHAAPAAGHLETQVIAGLEVAYQLAVKPR